MHTMELPSLNSAMEMPRTAVGVARRTAVIQKPKFPHCCIPYCFNLCRQLLTTAYDKQTCHFKHVQVLNLAYPSDSFTKFVSTIVRSIMFYTHS